MVVIWSSVFSFWVFSFGFSPLVSRGTPQLSVLADRQRRKPIDRRRDARPERCIRFKDLARLSGLFVS